MEGSMAVYDTTRDRIIVFGGLTGVQGNGNSVYELKRDIYGNYKVTELLPTGTKPAPRWLGACTYDATNDRAVFLFGGNASGPINNCFALTFTGDVNGAWSTLTPSGTAPTATAAMAFDRAVAGTRLYIHGGATNSALTTVSNQFYYWNVSTNAWQILTSTGSTARRGHVMADNPDGVNIWGGFNGSAVIQTHQRFSESWGNITDTVAPDARRSVVGGYFNSKFYIFAGRPNTGTWYRDTWSRGSLSSSAAWTNENPIAYIPAWFAFTGGSNAQQYHWQAWALEDGTRTSDYEAFPESGNSEATADFILGVAGGGGGGAASGSFLPFMMG